jgi:16S rRNA (cytosine1402-N4)-methyltransferase
VSDPVDTVPPAHTPVMTAEVVSYLGDRRTVIDMTLGAGGHAEALLRAGVARVIGVDRDPSALSLAQERLAAFGDRVRFVAARFSEVDADTAGGPVDGVLFDLGVSSMQIDGPDRGFGYRVDGPLDMRMGDEGDTAADLVNQLSEKDLADLIFEYGQEHRSRRVAHAIVRQRPILTTDQLARVVAGALGRRPGGPHPARRTFQALRIAVNRELEELAASLPQAVELLGPGGRVVAIAYHSLEDRIVKFAFRDDERLTPLTKKPQRPGDEEVARNPRARSALLRAAERTVQAA